MLCTERWRWVGKRNTRRGNCHYTHVLSKVALETDAVYRGVDGIPCT